MVLTKLKKGGIMKNGMTRKQIAAETGAPWYTVHYLNSLGKLPIIRDSSGPGNPVIFDQKAVDVVKAHLRRNGSHVS